MAVVVGNITWLLDVTSPRTVILDRKIRPVAADIVLSLHKKDSHQITSIANTYPSLATRSFELDGEARGQRVVTRGKTNSEVNGVDFDSDEENGNGNGDGEELPFDWKNQMRERAKEIEERRELERIAEELQNRVEEESEGRLETEEEKRLRVRKELEMVAKEQAERRATAQLMFDLGQKAYGKGMYHKAVEYLEAALTIIPRSTLFGGEIQIWLAMAYDANDRRADCIALYLQLETKHPSFSIRRQAAELRYISEAPKLKVSDEVKLTFPMFGSSYDSYAIAWSDQYKDKSVSTSNQRRSKDYWGDFFLWRPPVGLEKSRAFWVALTLWFGLVGAALFLQR